MSGYSGWSMSNNAVTAYENGEKPKSKWSKAAILQEIKENDSGAFTCSIDVLQKMPINLLRDVLLLKTSWHHTSSRYNKTDFYAINFGVLETKTDDYFLRLKKTYQEEKLKKGEPTLEEKWECEFLEWSGSRKHPKATPVKETGIVKGTWFYRTNGTKKSTTSNGFKFLRKIN